jgi:hypothetical protein
MSDWFVLRTNGRSTLPLAASLKEAGFDVWTPSQIPDGRGKRASLDDPRAPMYPTYLFARAHHLFELIALSANPGRNHAGFSVHRDCNGVPLVADRALNWIRAEEARIDGIHIERARRERAKQKSEAYSPGESVELPRELYPSFAGLEAQVDRSDGRQTHLSIGPLKIEISTWILRNNSVRDADSPSLGEAA